MKKETGKPRWQAARPSARQTCVLPVPELPRAITLSRATRYSQRASSRVERLVERWNGGEVERVETLHRRKTRGADAALDHAPFAIDEFEFGEAQKEADMIETLAGGLCGDLFIFAQEGRQFELTQMMREQNLRRRRAGGRSRCRHAALPETRTI